MTAMLVTYKSFTDLQGVSIDVDTLFRLLHFAESRNFFEENILMGLELFFTDEKWHNSNLLAFGWLWRNIKLQSAQQGLRTQRIIQTKGISNMEIHRNNGRCSQTLQQNIKINSLEIKALDSITFKALVSFCFMFSLYHSHHYNFCEIVMLTLCF